MLRMLISQKFINAAKEKQEKRETKCNEDALFIARHRQLWLAIVVVVVIAARCCCVRLTFQEVVEWWLQIALLSVNFDTSLILKCRPCVRMIVRAHYKQNRRIVLIFAGRLAAVAVRWHTARWHLIRIPRLARNGVCHSFVMHLLDWLIFKLLPRFCVAF